MIVTLWYKYEPQSVSENSLTVSYYDRSVTTSGTIHNSRPDIVMLDKAIKATYLMHTAIPSSHHLHSSITDGL